jgi:hypothetical protein
LTHFDAYLTHFRLLVVVCLAAYAAGQGFRKKTSGPTTPATVQKQVAAGVSLFCLFTFLNHWWNSQKSSGPTTPATVQNQVAAGVRLCICLLFLAKTEETFTILAPVQKQVAAGVSLFV